jgi:four helix bundle protein
MQDFKQRTFLFAVAVGRLIVDLPYNAVNKVYFNQLVKSSSSIGANYRAAKRAKSDADFINKLKIVEEEADESIYFLELLREFNPTFKERIISLINEGTEILKIIVSSITTTRARLHKEANK